MGNTFVLTVVDRSSKIMVFIHVPNAPLLWKQLTYWSNPSFKIMAFPYMLFLTVAQNSYLKSRRDFTTPSELQSDFPLVFTLSQKAKLNISIMNLRLHLYGKSTIIRYLGIFTLPGLNNTHNILTSSATRLSSFHASQGYLPPLFSIQETEVAILSV